MNTLVELADGSYVQLRDGERLVDGRVLYSAGWLGDHAPVPRAIERQYLLDQLAGAHATTADRDSEAVELEACTPAEPCWYCRLERPGASAH